MKTETRPPMRRLLPDGARSAAVLLVVLFGQTRTSFGDAFSGPLAVAPAGIGQVNGAGFTFGVETVNPPGGALYGPNGDLANIGALGPVAAGYGSLGAPSLLANYVGGIGNPLGPLNPGGITAFQPAVGGFGGTIGGQSTMFASTFANARGAGIFWTPPTFLGDAGADGNASVNLSRGIATFQYTGTSAKIPGVALAISGTLGGQGAAGAFVAASLVGTFQIYNAAGVLQSTESTSVVIVSDGPGPRGDFVAATPSVAGDTFLSRFLVPGANTFSAYGVDLLPSIVVPNGGYVKLDGTLSLVADPMASIQIDLLPLDVPLPDLGPIVGAAVPEPGSAYVIVVGALGALGVLRHRRNARPTLV